MGNAGDRLRKALIRNRRRFGRVIRGIEYRDNDILIFDLTKRNRQLMRIIDSAAEVKDKYIKAEIKAKRAKIGIGRYNEQRPVYGWSGLFNGDGTERDIHLGTDIFVPKGTTVAAFYAGRVHSFMDNDRPGDYGPTVILEHRLDGIKFYTLYGHLSRSSLKGKRKGKAIGKGETIGYVGGIGENGGWPEHVHLQVIRRIEIGAGDFPGVASRKTLRRYLALCPDPNLILNVKQ